MKLKPLAGLAVATLLASCAGDTHTSALSSAPAPTDEKCFRPNDVTAFDQLGETRFLVHTQRGDVYSADLPVCNGIDWVQRVAIKPSRSSQICEGDVGSLVTQDAGGHTLTCDAYNFHHLSTAEIAALPSRARP